MQLSRSVCLHAFPPIVVLECDSMPFPSIGVMASRVSELAGVLTWCRVLCKEKEIVDSTLTGESIHPSVRRSTVSPHATTAPSYALHHFIGFSSSWSTRSRVSSSRIRLTPFIFSRGSVLLTCCD